MNSSEPKKLSGPKRLRGLLVFVLVVVGSISLGLWLARQMQRSAPVEAEGEVPDVVYVVLGAGILFLGLVGYLLVYATNAFTFNFQQPYLGSYAAKMRLINIFVGLGLIGGLSMMVAPYLARLLAGIVPGAMLRLVSFFAPFIAFQVFLFWFDMFAPLNPAMIRRRMRGLGFSPEQIASGVAIGISDPASKRQLGLVEDDMGMMWFTPDTLMYRGDSRWFDIQRQHLVAVERQASGRSMAAYFGAVHVVIRYIDADGAYKSLMVHPENSWTASGAARELDRLAKMIEEWRQRTTLPAPAISG